MERTINETYSHIVYFNDVANRLLQNQIYALYGRTIEKSINLSLLIFYNVYSLLMTRKAIYKLFSCTFD